MTRFIIVITIIIIVFVVNYGIRRHDQATLFYVRFFSLFYCEESVQNGNQGFITGIRKPSLKSWLLSVSSHSLAVTFN